MNESKMKICKEYNRYRCCYLDKNNKRCNNTAVGWIDLPVFGNNNNKTIKIFSVNCKKHQKECEKIYKIYKTKYCKSVYDTIDTDNTISRKKMKQIKVCEETRGKKVKSKTKTKNKTNRKYSYSKKEELLSKCINKRVEYKKCIDGCLYEPYNKDSYDEIKKQNLFHDHEINLLIQNKLQCNKINSTTKNN